MHAKVKGSHLGLLQHGSSRHHKIWNAKLAVLLLKHCSARDSKLSDAVQLMGVV